MKIIFRDLKIGDKFECWGDLFINYDYPKLCICVKTSSDVAEETDGGISFLVNPNDEVFPHEEEKKNDTI